jgi:signal transduction histidine kinase
MMLRSQLRTEKLELREKLSRDLHDDLASTLGSISIYAGTLNRILEPASSDHKKLTQKITSLTQSALQSISEIIWMTSPRNDTLQSLISKTSNYMLELLTDNRIRFVPDVNIPDEAAVLPDKVRNDTFLILKEGLHNVIRHSGADTVRFVVRTSAARCYITLKDNGVGMPDSKNRQISGNGLTNMKKRAEESGVSFRIHSSPGNGVEILLEFQI